MSTSIRLEFLLWWLLVALQNVVFFSNLKEKHYRVIDQDIAGTQFSCQNKQSYLMTLVSEKIQIKDSSLLACMLLKNFKQMENKSD